MKTAINVIIALLAFCISPETGVTILVTSVTIHILIKFFRESANKRKRKRRQEQERAERERVRREIEQERDRQRAERDRARTEQEQERQRERARKVQESAERQRIREQEQKNREQKQQQREQEQAERKRQQQEREQNRRELRRNTAEMDAEHYRQVRRRIMQNIRDTDENAYFALNNNRSYVHPLDKTQKKLERLYQQLYTVDRKIQRAQYILEHENI